MVVELLFNFFFLFQYHYIFTLLPIPPILLPIRMYICYSFAVFRFHHFHLAFKWQWASIRQIICLHIYYFYLSSLLLQFLFRFVFFLLFFFGFAVIILQVNIANGIRIVMSNTWCTLNQQDTTVSLSTTNKLQWHEAQQNEIVSYNVIFTSREQSIFKLPMPTIQSGNRMERILRKMLFEQQWQTVRRSYNSFWLYFSLLVDLLYYYYYCEWNDYYLSKSENFRYWLLYITQ